MNNTPDSQHFESAPHRMGFNMDRPTYNAKLAVTVVPYFPPSDPRYGKTNITGSPGEYRVTFTLSVPGGNVYREKINLGNEHGDSLLIFPNKKNTLEILVNKIYKDDISVILSANEENRLAKVTLTFKAESIRHAEKTAYGIISSILSYLSYTNNVAIETAGFEVVEINTGTLKGTWGMIGNTKVLMYSEDAGRIISDNNLQRLLSAYREGMNATNIFYQALSFSKVIEGCQKLRGIKIRDAKRAKKPVVNPSLSIPANIEEIPDLDTREFDSFTPFLSQKFPEIKDHFRPIIRNAIAHLDPSQNILDIDRFEDVAKCTDAVPVLRYMARCYMTFELNN